MTGIRAKLLTLLAPTLSLGLLAAGGYVQREWPQPADAVPYHARAAAAVDSIPLRVGSWIGTEVKPQQAAIEILKPNAIRNIKWLDLRPGSLGRPQQSVYLSVVQCKRFDDMLGHSPPACYPAFGDRLVRKTQRNWQLPPDAQPSPTQPIVTPGENGQAAAGPTMASVLPIVGTEYEFERVIDGQVRRRIVYNFMIARHRGILPDMESLRQAAEDYEQRYFGAAQFQVVFDTLASQELPVGERDEIFTTLMNGAAPAIRVLLDENPEPSTPKFVPATRASDASVVHVNRSLSPQGIDEIAFDRRWSVSQ